MGFIVADSITLPNGLSVSNFVVSIGGRYNLYKMKFLNPTTNVLSTTYQLEYSIIYYASQTAYENNIPFQTDGLLRMTIDPSLITGDIFTIIYNNLKGKYTNFVDN